MNTKEIQKAICKMQVLKFHPIVCENISPGMSEHDVLSVNKSEYSYEFEVKISRQDFLKDKKKVLKHTMLENKVEDRCPNYFYYACPPGLISVDEIPEYAGLIYVSEEEIETIKRAPLLHRKKCDLKRVMLLALRLHQERKYLGCAFLTYKNNQIREANAKYFPEMVDEV